MKKIVIYSMIFSMFLATCGVALAQNTDQSNQISGVANRQQEKISHPGEIKFFDKIKKIGDSLFGVRKEEKQKPENKNNQEQNQKQENNSQMMKGDLGLMMENMNFFTAASGTGEQEKISNPGEMKLFDKIKKIGNSLFGIRKEESKKPFFIKPEVATCVKSAINVRLTAVKAAMTDQNSKVLALLDTRVACEIAALDKTTAQEQFDANQLCITADQKAGKEIAMAFEKSREAAQKTFQASVKVCVGVATGTTAVSQ